MTKQVRILNSDKYVMEKLVDISYRVASDGVTDELACQKVYCINTGSESDRYFCDNDGLVSFRSVLSMEPAPFGTEYKYSKSHTTDSFKILDMFKETQQACQGDWELGLFLFRKEIEKVFSNPHLKIVAIRDLLICGTWKDIKSAKRPRKLLVYSRLYHWSYLIWEKLDDLRRGDRHYSMTSKKNKIKEEILKHLE